MFGPEVMQAFREFKAIWDPENRMNPGKIVDAYRPDQNLRLGAGYRPWNPRTHFAFAEDGFSMPDAVLRCVGVGKCRRYTGGTMCPSYMVTHEEKHATRGRARLLFEMFNGALPDGWRSREVRDALDLCLACKGCKRDCPVGVDMATYKAEFYSHYYAGRLRPMTAYSLGLIHWWARLAAQAPRLANLMTHLPGLDVLVKRLAGIAPQRTIPVFAPKTFKQWWFAREQKVSGRADFPPPGGGRRVILWPDTFNNHFHPEVARAAVRVLEAAGFEIDVPGRALCCGRPLYDFGFLTQAKRLLVQILTVLRDDLRAGTPVVFLEPSCASVFRDELTNLLPHDADALRLREQSFLLSEFLQRYAAGWSPGQLERRALVHGHCHHKSLMGMSAEEAVLRRVVREYSIPDDGCCGMAGAFGFEREHVDVSLACAERALIPAVCAEAEDTLLVTDGFSCREQIAQTTGRRSLHLAQLLEMALDP
jgi:Fe-S oxidoreductase